MRIKIHPQFQQFLTLFVLFAVGKFYANIYPSWLFTAAMLLTAALTEHIFIFFRRGTLEYFSFSPLSTAFGVLLMLSATRWWIYAIVILLSLLQKHYLTVNNRHFFNPSNFALIVAMLLFYDKSHIILGQLGDESWMRAIVVILSISILMRVDRWVISVSFALFYLLASYLFVVHYDPMMTFEMITDRFYAVSFVVFIAFMLTDPRTTPEPRWQQVIFAFVIAVMAVYMDRIGGFRAQHIFMALFAVSVWVPALKDRKAFPFSLTLFILALGAIIYIESQPPYFFDMEG